MNYLVLISFAIFFIGCAHHQDVRPGADGVHRVVVSTDDKEAGSRDAIAQAEHFCEKRGGKYPAFINEEDKYVGDMDEKTYKKSKTAAKVAKAAGSALWVFGGKNESNAGGIVGLGGGIADQALGKGYKVEMKFKCQ